MKYLKAFEKYFDTRDDIEGYVDANELVGQRLWFHTNRTHQQHNKNGMIGVYDTSPTGRKKGYASRYTNEVRLTEPIFFQASESGAEHIRDTGHRVLIAGVSGVVVPTNDDITGMIKIMYNPSTGFTT